MSNNARDGDMDLLEQFRVGSAALATLQPDDHRGGAYWDDIASAMTRVIEAWALIRPRFSSQLHRDAITKLIDDAMDAFACRDDTQLRQAMGTAYSIWTTCEFISSRVGGGSGPPRHPSSGA